MVVRVPMPSTARPRLSIQKAYAHFSSWEIGERLSEELPRGWRDGLRRQQIALHSTSRPPTESQQPQQPRRRTQLIRFSV